MKKSTKKRLKQVKEYAIMTIGLLLYCFAWKGFLLPHTITGGGITGVASIIYYATGIPVAISYFSINVCLLIISVMTIGWKFSLRSIYGVFVLTFFLSVVPEAPIGTFVPQEEGLMACLIGGILWGVGYGLIFLSHGSSGGTTIMAKIINKYYPNISLGRALLFCDILIICSAYFFVTNSLVKIVYGLVTMAITTYVVDLVESGIRQSVQFFIFSKKYEQIADRINKEIGKGVTVIDGVGWYSKESIKMISVIARKRESSDIFQIIKEIDPDAFISQSDVIGVYGRGFEKMK
jgi:uncharacterized membrane-anchored protein YitT (DUF2179 family)